jgi:predicted MFS family arabinose efflux permease
VKAASERTIVTLVGAVQFVNILDFMIVMPLGPDFAGELNIEAAHLGWVGGSYTAAAAVAGLVGSLFLERFDRRKALGVAVMGLVIGTAMGALATGLWTMILARVVAGSFGGPATSIALATIADTVPPERRGRALGAVMGAFSLASVIGVPVGLELGRLGGWRTPFLAVAGLGLGVALSAVALLPPLRAHLAPANQHPDPGLRALLARPAVLLAFLCTFLVMGGAFAIIPYISPYIQGNLHFPRADIGTLYFAGGIVSFFTTRIVGRLLDRIGVMPIGLTGCTLLVAVMGAGFAVEPPWLPVPAAFVGFMFAMGVRNLPFNTLMSLVPGPAERARFLSLQSCVQHLSAALGSFFAAQVLVSGEGGRVEGMGVVTATAMVLTAAIPLVYRGLERRVWRVKA